MLVQANLERLLFILTLTQEQLYNYLKERCKTDKREFIGRKNKGLFVHGKCDVTLVAHLDTAGDAPSKKEIYCQNEMIGLYAMKDNKNRWKRVLGGDDRCGVECALTLGFDNDSKYQPNVLFTFDEEIGCKGVDAILTDDAFDVLFDQRLLIQLDRRGIWDAVFYDVGEEVLQDFIIQNFGFSHEYGSFSDISELCPEYCVQGVNFSVGYFNEHSESEHIYFPVVSRTAQEVGKVIQEVIDKDMRFPLEERVATAGRGYGSSLYDDDYYSRYGSSYALNPETNAYEPVSRANGYKQASRINEEDYTCFDECLYCGSYVEIDERSGYCKQCEDFVISESSKDGVGK